jgi:hypothetical protein
MRGLRFVPLTSFVLIISAPARAQLDTSFLAGQAAQMGTSLSLAECIKRRSAQAGGNAPLSESTDSVITGLSFKPSTVVRRRTVAAFVARPRRLDRSTAEGLEKTFSDDRDSTPPMPH